MEDAFYHQPARGNPGTITVSSTTDPESAVNEAADYGGDTLAEMEAVREEKPDYLGRRSMNKRISQLVRQREEARTGAEALRAQLEQRQPQQPQNDQAQQPQPQQLTLEQQQQLRAAQEYELKKLEVEVKAPLRYHLAKQNIPIWTMSSLADADY